MKNETEWTGTWCPHCGPNVQVDEDGCCDVCGSDAVGDGAERALEVLKTDVTDLLEQLSTRLWEAVRHASMIDETMTEAAESVDREVAQMRSRSDGTAASSEEDTLMGCGRRTETKENRVYRCAHPGCTTMRNVAEGGAIFTVCEEHWSSSPPKGK